ncbi:hypothetical protein LDENG_00021740 [Lucifuga dentata]|nr:hypothetical protein LDENG_00021740 [Lucifuga dentata]
MCCSKRGLYWQCESTVKHSGASCFRPYKGPGPPCLCWPLLFLGCVSLTLSNPAGKKLFSTRLRSFHST